VLALLLIPVHVTQSRWLLCCGVVCCAVLCGVLQVTYRGSSEERADLLRFYQEFGGNMSRVFDWLMLSRPDVDSHRFMDTIEAAIRAGALVGLFPGGREWGAWLDKMSHLLPATPGARNHRHARSHTISDWMLHLNIGHLGANRRLIGLFSNRTAFPSCACHNW
jgi:hypothetical protein